MAIKAPKLSTNNIIALCVVVSIILVFVLIGVGRSFYIRITHNARVITRKQVAEKQLKENLINLPLLSQSYDALGVTKTALDDSLPATPNFPALVASMEAISGLSGVTLQTVAPSSQVTTPSATTSSTPVQTGPQPFAFTTTTHSSYAALLAYLTNLQIYSRPIAITGLQISGTTPSVTATITGNTYYYTPQILVDKTEAVK